jgi:hypothetical protein
LTKNGLGSILGDFFTNSSGHPVAEPKQFYRDEEKASSKKEGFVSELQRKFLSAIEY